MNSQVAVKMLFFQLPSWAKMLPAATVARTRGGCRCPEQSHRELFVCPYQLASTFHAPTAGMLAGFGRWLFPAVVPAGISSSQTCTGESGQGCLRGAESALGCSVPLQAALPGQSHPPSPLPRAENCLCASRAEGKKISQSFRILAHKSSPQYHRFYSAANSDNFMMGLMRFEKVWGFVFFVFFSLKVSSSWSPVII